MKGFVLLILVIMDMSMIRKHPRKPSYSEVCGFHRLSYGEATRLVRNIDDDGLLVDEEVDSEDFYEDEDWERKGFEVD